MIFLHFFFNILIFGDTEIDGIGDTEIDGNNITVLQILLAIIVRNICLLNRMDNFSMYYIVLIVK